MFPPLFLWLDDHPAVYWAGAAAATLALAAQVAAGLRRNPDPATAWRREWIFAGLVLLCLFAWRWPFLFCASEYNPDESQFVAGALTLAHDPVFWRSVDGTTSGPLNFYAVLPLHWLGLPLDYFTVRLAALILAGGTLWLLWHSLRRVASPAVAGLAIAPAALFLSVVTEPDFVHYSSEAVPLALIATAVALAPRHSRAAAFAAGLLPWAKLQALPLGTAFVLWQLAMAPAAAGRSRGREALALIAAAAAPSLLIVALVAAAGQFAPFWHRYVLQNIAYAGGGGQTAAVLQDLWRQAGETGLFPLWAGGSGLLVLVAAGFYLARRQAPSPRFWLGAALTGAALFAIVLPARASLHYVLLLLAPLAWWSGAAFCDLAAGRRTLAALTLALALGLLGLRAHQPAPEMIGRLAEHWRTPRTALAEVLRHWRRDGARLSVWGWMNSAYAESGLPQATRDMLTVWSIQPSPQRAYHRAGYLADFRERRPELFLDAVGPGAPFFENRSMAGHETFPELAALVAEDYQPVIELGPARLYARRDFLAAHPLGRVEMRRLVARGRPVYDEARPPDVVAPASAPWTKVGEHSYQMLEPATELRWRLAGDERSVVFRFGFEPRAYLEGHTDGAEFIVELRPPGQPPLRVAARWLDPVGRPADREPATLQADLPPYPPGTLLVVRCSPGPAGNAAWDWVYFDHLRFARSPYYASRQFPGFRRLPDEVDAAYPHLVQQDAGWLLMLPPPATLTFVLEGNERHFNFRYGLGEGAYTGAGRTDGALYQVRLQRAGAAPRLVYERRLDPLGNPADRGPQDADLSLPADVRPGDRLQLHIGAGESTSWDWTYVSALELR